MVRLGLEVGDRYLVRAERALDLLSVHDPGPGPPLGRAQHDHWPARARRLALGAGDFLNPGYLIESLLECRRQLLVHRIRLVARNEDRCMPITLQEGAQLRLRDPGEHGRVGDLVSVQVKDRQHGAVAPGVQELVRVPAGRQRAGLRLAVSDDAEDGEVRVVESRAVGVKERVAQLAAFVYGSGRLGCDVARDAAWKRELPEELPHAGGVCGDVRVDLAVGAFEVRIRDRPRAAMTRPHDVDRVEVSILDHAVGVGVDEVEARRGAPVAEQPRLDVLQLQSLEQQRVVQQVDLADRDVVRRPPVRVDEAQLLLAEWLPRHHFAGASSSRRPAMRALLRLVFMIQATSLSLDCIHFSKYGWAFSGAAAAATLQQ